MGDEGVGRHSKASTGKAYSVLAPGTHWKWLGYLGVLAGFLILVNSLLAVHSQHSPFLLLSVSNT